MGQPQVVVIHGAEAQGWASPPPATKEIYGNLVDTKPAAHACCQFTSDEGVLVPWGGTVNGRTNGPDSLGGPSTGPSQLM